MNIMNVDYSTKIPNNVESQRGPPGAARRWRAGIPAISTGGTTWGRTASSSRWSICAPPIRSIRRAGPSSTMCKMPDYRWGILLAPQEENRVIPFGEHLRRAGLAGSAGRISRHAAPPDRDPGRHRAGVGRAAAPSRQDRALALRHAQPVPGQCRGRPPSLGDGLSAAEIFRPRRPRGGRRVAAPPLGRCGQPAHARRLQRGDAGLAVVLHVHLSSPTATARCSCTRWRSPASIRCRAPAASC